MKSALRPRDVPELRTDGVQIKRIRNRVEDEVDKICVQNLPSIQEFELITLLENFGTVKAF